MDVVRDFYIIVNSKYMNFDINKYERLVIGWIVLRYYFYFFKDVYVLGKNCGKNKGRKEVWNCM